MHHKNVDGIKKFANKKLKTAIFKPGVLRLDAIYRKYKAPKVFAHQAPVKNKKAFSFKPAQQSEKYGAQVFYKFYSRQKVPVLAAVVALFLAFGGGILFTLNTRNSLADEENLIPQVLAEQSTNANLSSTRILGSVNSVPNDVLFNMTIAQLENYLDNAIKPSEVKEAESLADRKAKLKIYLHGKNSPFVDIVDTIAELKHWKLVLAISNSESSLGKRCYTNNCSGIGVDPDNPLWRTYAS